MTATNHITDMTHAPDGDGCGPSAKHEESIDEALEHPLSRGSTARHEASKDACLPRR